MSSQSYPEKKQNLEDEKLTVQLRNSESRQNVTERSRPGGTRIDSDRCRRSR